MHNAQTVALHAANASGKGVHQRHPAASGPSPVGLLNLGNTCYLNTTLQCLLHTHGLVAFLVRKQYQPYVTDRANKVDAARPETLKDGSRVDLRTHASCGTPSLQLLEVLGDVLRTLHQRHMSLRRGTAAAGAHPSQPAVDTPVDPKPFLRAVGLASQYRVRQGESASAFLVGQQHDLVEFLQFLLDVLHDTAQLQMTFKVSGTVTSMRDRMEVQAWEQMQKHYGKQYSYVTDMITGQYFIQSRTCDNVSPTEHVESYDPFTVLTLDLPLGRRSCTLAECLHLFVQPETIQGWKGELTSHERVVERRTFLWNLPDILILQLKRFPNQYVKNHCEVDFPCHLDLRDYCPRAEHTDTEYELYAVANHEGSLQYGHYYADCKQIDGNWHRYNDQQVTRIQEEELRHEAAYVLFFRRLRGTVVNSSTPSSHPPHP
jgi:ubiquitin C-terminal hydrolase